MVQVQNTLGAPPGLPLFVKVVSMAFPLTTPKPLRQTLWYQIRLWSWKLGGIWNLPCREHSSVALRKKIGHSWVGVTDPGRGQMGVFRCPCSGKAGWVTGQSVDRRVKSISRLAIGLWKVISDSTFGVRPGNQPVRPWLVWTLRISGSLSELRERGESCSISKMFALSLISKIHI